MQRIVLLFFIVIAGFSANCQTNIQDGDRCFDSGDYVCAINNYENAFKNATGRDKQIAEIKLTRAKWCAEHLKIANQAFSEKKYSTAKEEYQKVLDSNPQDSLAQSQIVLSFYQSYIQNGDLCFENGDYTCSISHYENAFKNASGKDKQVAEIKLTRAKWCSEHLKIANQAFEAKNYSTAKEEYQKVLDSNPQDSLAQSQIVICDNASNIPKLRIATSADIKDIWNNKYGILPERRQNLINAGIDPDDAQKRINAGEGKELKTEITKGVQQEGEKEQEKKALQNMLAKEYSLSQYFPDQDKTIKNTIQYFLKDKLFKPEMPEGLNIVDISVVYKRYDKYYFNNNSSLSFSKSLAQYLNERIKSFSPPKLTYFQQKYTEVNAFGSYNHKIHLSKKEVKVRKKNNKWDAENFEILNLINKNYNNTFSTRPDGKYSLHVKTVTLGKNKFYQTSGSKIEKYDGPGNMFYSVFIPSVGRNNVGLKNGNSWTFAILGLTAISVGSKLLSNSEYDKFLNANDQITLDKTYENANNLNKISIVSGGLGITLYSYNLLSVFSKGIKNKKNKIPKTTLPIITDEIILP